MYDKEGRSHRRVKKEGTTLESELKVLSGLHSGEDLSETTGEGEQGSRVSTYFTGRRHERVV